jgi:rhamnosyltransferase subunit B
MALVLMASFGSLGDLHPYIAVGRALQARGLRARIATCPDYRTAVESEGLEFAPMGPPLSDFGSPEELARRVFDSMRGSRHLVQELIMPHLRQAHQQLRIAAADADLLISHPLSFMLQVVAAEQDKPWLSSILAPASFLSRDDPPALAPVNSLQIARRMAPWVYDALLGYIRRTVRRWERPLHEYRRELGLPERRQVYLFEGQFSPHGTLAMFDAALMRPQPDWPAHTHICGAALYDGTIAEPQVLAQLEEFLAAGEAPIVFALGSSAVWLGRDFWTAAVAAMTRLGRRAILISGAAEVPPLPPSIRAFNYLPYSRVFPRACAVVHQAGIGTLSQALRAGRPQLITPVAFDQPDNAARAVKLGVARTLPFRRASAARLVTQLQELLSIPSYADAARDLAVTLNGTDGAAVAATYISEALQCSARPEPRRLPPSGS